MMVKLEDMPKLLAKLHRGKTEGAKASNRRMLWMAMRLLNEKISWHEATVFDSLVNELLEVAG